MDTRQSPIDRLRDPLADPVYDRRRLRMAAMFLVTGVLHFVVPGPFRRIVPRWFPWGSQAVACSGVAELGSALLLGLPRTKRLGGMLAAATLVAVFPANVQMALDASRSGSSSSVRRLLVWGRLPLQVPLIIEAARLAREG